MYEVCAEYVLNMYEVCTEHVSYIQASSFVEQFSCSLYQTARLKASQQHIPSQSKHSFKSSRFRFSTPSGVLLLSDSFPLQERPPAGPAGPADRQAAHPRVRASRASRTGLSRSAAAPASAAALDTAAELKERRKDTTSASGPYDFNMVR
jgi:hypothetical protein